MILGEPKFPYLSVVVKLSSHQIWSFWRLYKWLSSWNGLLKQSKTYLDVFTCFFSIYSVLVCLRFWLPLGPSCPAHLPLTGEQQTGLPGQGQEFGLAAVGIGIPMKPEMSVPRRTGLYLGYMVEYQRERERKKNISHELLIGMAQVWGVTTCVF